MTLAMSGATQEDAGLASGLVNTAAQVGGALGLAVLATLSATRSDSLIEGGEATASALTSGYHLAFLIGAGLVAGGDRRRGDGAPAGGAGREAGGGRGRAGRRGGGLLRSRVAPRRLALGALAARLHGY